MDIYWIWLSLVKYIGPVLQKRLLNEFGSPESIYSATPAELEKNQSINKRAVRSIIDSRDLSRAEKIFHQCEQKGIRILTYFDDLYPSFAKKIKESPVLLYYKGHLQEITTAVGVVGARRCTPYGRKIAEELGEKLAFHGIPLISGFAKGIDSYVQAACINNGGYAALFLASGVDICYPPEQRNLYQKTLDTGGIFLSQFAPGTHPKPAQFLQRNALISAWSTELVVVEAGEKSGALWTAEFAQKQGKPFYSVPHPIHTQEGKGSNLLLKQGAIPFLGWESLAAMQKEIHVQVSDASPNQPHNPILELLQMYSPISIPFLAKVSHMSESSMLEKLFSLELEGKVIIRGNIVSLL